jgi:hypothetical protein
VFTEGDSDFNAALKKADIIELNGSGDFRSQECIDILKTADIAVTNPPFSLFRQWVALMGKYNKDYIVLGTPNAPLLNQVMRLFREQKLSAGFTHYPGGLVFDLPDGTTEAVHVTWYTTLPIRRPYTLVLTQKYDSQLHQKYHNFDAINVNSLAEIPYDYLGFMGVPPTYMFHHNHEHYELFGTLCSTDENGNKATREYEFAYKVNENGTHKRIANPSINPMLHTLDKPTEAGYIVVDGLEGYLIPLFARVLIRKKAESSG